MSSWQGLRSTGQLVIATLGISLGACSPKGDAVEPGDKAAPTSSEGDFATLAVDGQRMLADVEHLASDEFAGRYTLSDSLARSTDWLAQRYEKLGLKPVGEDFRVPFALTTGAKLEGEQALVVHKKRDRPIAAKSFTPIATSGSGTARGELVFVGYAAQAEEVPATEPDEDGEGGSEGHPAYDDLAGLDLKDKIALVLLDAPGRPDFRAFFAKLQELATKFENDAKPLVDAEDEAGMRKLHENNRKELAVLVEPFTRGHELPDSFWKLPDDVMTSSISLQRILAPLMALELPGPQFDPGENFSRTKLERLEKAGAAGVILVRGPRSYLDDESRKKAELPKLDEAGSFSEISSVPVVQVRWQDADANLRVGKKKLSALQKKIDVDQKPQSARAEGVEVTITTGVQPIQKPVPNVVGQIPGTDLADEIVLLGAHYDHLGTAEDGTCTAIDRRKKKDTICNGADDNASGSAMVLEVVRALKDAGVQPRRTVVFTHFAGEELGLFGSKALADNPPWNGRKVVAMVNLDMVGRLGRRGLAIGGIGSSNDWMPMLDEIGNNGMDVVYERSVATRSDHANFYRKEIPVLFFFTGIHSDYHRAGDHTDKINPEGMQSIGQIVGQVMVRLANGYALAYSAPEDGEGLSNGLPGENPDTVEKRVEAGSD
jgi:hypothetical protein